MSCKNIVESSQAGTKVPMRERSRLRKVVPNLICAETVKEGTAGTVRSLCHFFQASFKYWEAAMRSPLTPPHLCNVVQGCWGAPSVLLVAWTDVLVSFCCVFYIPLLWKYETKVIRRDATNHTVTENMDIFFIYKVPGAVFSHLMFPQHCLFFL